VVIGIVVVTIVILGIVEPTDITVTRSAVIKAPKERVFEHIVNFKSWPKWSPWSEKDTAIKITYSGTDGQPGSSYHWIGQEHITGEGEMKNTAVEGTKMNYELNVMKPWEMESVGTFSVKDTTGGSKVTWTLTKHTPFPGNAMMAFVKMDKYLGGDFELGLANLKKVVESSAPPATIAEIKEVDYPEHLFEGIRKSVGWDELQKFFSESYSLIGKGLGPAITGSAAGLFYQWDTVNKRTDVLAAFPVKDTTTPVVGAVFARVPASKAYMAAHKGGYSSEKNEHEALGKYMSAKGARPSLVIEEYMVGPFQEPDSNKWVTNIYYLVQ